VTFSFHRGSIALDFVGTVGSRASPEPEERLPGPSALAVWLAEAKLAAGTHPATADLERARALREAIYVVATSMLSGKSPDRGALLTINRAAAGLRFGAPRLGPSGRVRWVTRRPVQVALARIAVDAMERLEADVDRLTRCELEGCGALLLSRSRSDRRRWCSMETCGNRAKAVAYRARRRGQADAE